MHRKLLRPGDGRDSYSVFEAVTAALSERQPSAVSKRGPGRPRSHGRKQAWMLYRDLMLVLLYHEARDRGQTAEHARTEASTHFKTLNPRMKASASTVAKALANLQPELAQLKALVVRRSTSVDQELTDFDIEILNELAQEGGSRLPITREDIQKGSHIAFGFGYPPRHVSLRGTKKTSRIVFGKSPSK